MIPRSLAAAVIIGAAAAGLLGAAVEMYGSGAISSSEDGPALALLTSAREYAAGEGVAITVLNTGITALEFAEGTAYGIRITQLDGIPVYSSAAEGASSLDAGGAGEFVWDQGRDGGERVYAGTYVIRSEAASPGGERVGDSVAVEIR